jgi:hypothetical protein
LVSPVFASAVPGLHAIVCVPLVPLRGAARTLGDEKRNDNLVSKI